MLLASGTGLSGSTHFLAHLHLCLISSTFSSRRVSQRSHHTALKMRFSAHGHHLSTSILLLPASFWLLVILQILGSGVVSSYTSSLADFVRVTRNISPAKAGRTRGIDYIIFMLTPVFGLVFHYTGHRSLYITCTTALYILVFTLLGFTHVNELAPIILGSVASCSNAIRLIALVPLLVSSQAIIGTAFGLWEAFNSA